MTTEMPPPPSVEFISRLGLPQLCGQLLVVGFEGTRLPESLAEAIRGGLRGGVILFKRNVPDIETAWRLCREIAAAFPPEVTPFIAIDQEGGRVCRLPPPFLTLPPMWKLGELGNPDLTYRAACEVGRQLLALGITCNFAPVLDVHSNPDNPIIGDRSFGSDPVVVAEHANAFARGLEDAGVAACGKHFPGHGDTSTDSHLDLPVVTRRAGLLSKVELYPFRKAIDAGISSLMSAHVSYPALDATAAPATLSEPIVGKLLRKRLGFGGVLFSDDLEMNGVLKTHTLPEAACGAIRCGCDALLVCSSEQHADDALSALVNAAEADPSMSMRILEANARFHRLRKRFPPQPAQTVESLLLTVSPDASLRLTQELFPASPEPVP